MPIIGEVVSFNGVTLASIGAGLTGLAQIRETEPVDLEEMYLRRPGATPLYTPPVIPPAILLCVFPYQTYAELQGLVRILDYPYVQALRSLVAYRGNPTALVARSIQVTVDMVRINPGQVEVTMSAPESVWRSTAGNSVQLGPVTVSANGNTVIANNGDLSVRGIARFSWTVQRTTHTATHGWKRRAVVSVTAGTEPLVRKTVFYNLGNTSIEIASGNMQSNGDDIRVFHMGQDLPRQLVGQNSQRTHIAWVVDIPAGATAEYEIAWKNPLAVSPHELDDYTLGDLARYSALDMGSASGSTTGASTNTVVVDLGSPNWPVNRWAGCYVLIQGGTGAGQMRKVLSNTASTFTVARAFTTAPISSQYLIVASGFVLDGGGATSSTSTVVTDTNQSFVPNSLKGGTLAIISGTGSGQSKTIISNTTTAITVASAFSPAPVAGSSYTVEKNGFQRYYVDRIAHTEAWRGLWKVNKRSTKPSLVRFGAQGVPDGWTPDIYLDNRDDKSQVRVYTDAGVSGHSFPIFRSVRRRNSDRDLPEKNQADGVRTSDPRGWDAIKFDYNYRNEGGVGRFVVGGKEAGGEDWEPFFENAATDSTLGLEAMQSLDLSPYGLPTHLIMATAPQDGVEIAATASLLDEITVESGTTMEMYLNTASWTPPAVVDAAHDAYDMGAWLRIGGGATPTAPYEIVESGGVGHRVFLKTGQQLWIDSRNGEIAIYDVADQYLKAVPWAALIWQYELDQHSTAVRLPSRDFLRLPGGSTTLYYGETSMGTIKVDYFGATAFLT